MTRLDYIESQISLLRMNGKHIVYLVTEERGLLQEVFAHSVSTLMGVAGKAGANAKRLHELMANTNKANFYKIVANNDYFIDAYRVFNLGLESSLRLFDAEVRENKSQPEALLHKALFLYMNDFHALRGNLAAQFLNRFLFHARQKEANAEWVTLFLQSPVLEVPSGFSDEVMIIEAPGVNEAEIETLLLAEASKESDSELTGKDKERIHNAAHGFKGLTPRQIIAVTADLQSEYGSFYGRSGDASGSTDSVRAIEDIRKTRIKAMKTLSAKQDSTVTLKEPGSAVAGMNGYFDWLGDVKDEFIDPESARKKGNTPPKGVLLTGVPGSGKTQTAKATAAILESTLVELRMDNILGGIVGESEAKFKRCRQRIEALAPCVVLIDEIEKTFNTSENRGSSDAKQNIFTALLDWLQENEKQIFFFATSNNVKIKPELLRDGRFSMRYCVFMPTHEELVDIFDFHMRESAKRAKRDKLYPNVDNRALADAFLTRAAETVENGGRNLFYTGANIENLVVVANRYAHKHGLTDLKTLDFMEQVLWICVKGDLSQPYGVTNMRDIADFWLDARENQYANAGRLNLFPFESFDADAEKENFDKNVRSAHKYDRVMYRRITAEIEKRYAERRKHNG